MAFQKIQLPTLFLPYGVTSGEPTQDREVELRAMALGIQAWFDGVDAFSAAQQSIGRTTAAEGTQGVSPCDETSHVLASKVR